MKVLIAGGAGFLGSHLVDYYLARGHKVMVFDNLSSGRFENVDDRAGFLKIDIRQSIEFDECFDLIFNMASPASPPRYQAAPLDTLDTNVLGTQNLLKLAKFYNATMVQASTSEIYGDPLVHPQPEHYWGHVNSWGPRACYDEGKRAAEAYCYEYLQLGVDVRVARIFNTYGPRMDPDDGRVVSNFIKQALAGKPLTVFGDGSQTRSFCYVDDMVEGLARLAALPEAPFDPVNLGNPAECTILELANRVKRLTSSSSPIVFGLLPVDDPTRRRPDIFAANALLGWTPQVDLETGLARMIAGMQ